MESMKCMGIGLREFMILILRREREDDGSIFYCVLRLID